MGGGKPETIKSTTGEVSGCVCHVLWGDISGDCGGLLVSIHLGQIDGA